MVIIERTNTEFVFKLSGFHKIWALRSSITISKQDLIRAYQDQDELNKFPGFRFGTYIPFLITAGTYFLKGKRNYWDVMDKKNTVIIELQSHYFSKLYIQVKNPLEAIQMLNFKL